jgi:hypothetical protein
MPTAAIVACAISNAISKNSFMAADFLTTKELAAALGRSRTYVCAMKRHGFAQVMPGRYTLAAAVDWLHRHPAFRFSTAYKHRTRKPSIERQMIAMAAACANKRKHYPA